MKYLLSFLLVAISIGLPAQDKKSKKLYKQYEKGNYKKCEKLAKNFLQEDKSNPDANYLLGVILLQNARSSTSKSSKKRTFKEALKKRENIKNRRLIQYIQLSDSIELFIQFSLADDKISNSYKKYYVAVLAEEFNDTLDIYWDLFKSNQLTTSSIPLSIKDYPQDSLRRIMLELAQNLEGTPYKWAGDSPKSGFDCSGFTSYVYESVGIQLPHSAQKQSELIKKRKALVDAIPGDLIFFGSKNGKNIYTQHAGIIFSIEGDDVEVVHCVSNGVNIEGKDSSWDRYWINEVLFVVDVLSNRKDIPQSD